MEHSKKYKHNVRGRERLIRGMDEPPPLGASRRVHPPNLHFG